ncbi:MAG: hypothetical protein ACHREM_19940, partial [Polyangiales bacterium]
SAPTTDGLSTRSAAGMVSRVTKHSCCALGAALAMTIGAGSLSAVACFRPSTNCPSQIPRSGYCHDPDQAVCDYRLPCGEKATCTCTSDDNGGSWGCIVDGANGRPATSPALDNTYSCASCPAGLSGIACIDASSKLLTPPP